jgi:hypothetical protein
MKKNVMWIVIIVVVALGSGYGGMLYGKNSAPKNTAGANWQNQAGRGQGGPSDLRRNGGANGGGFVNGEILSKDANSLTIKLNDGGSKIVFLSGKTIINKMATGTVADLEVGKNVMINGSAGSDGNVTAESIQLRPAFVANSSSTPAGIPSGDKPAK